MAESQKRKKNNDSVIDVIGPMTMVGLPELIEETSSVESPSVVQWNTSRNNAQADDNLSGGRIVRAYLTSETKVLVYSSTNVKSERSVRNPEDGLNRLYILPGERVLVPTGSSFDLFGNYQIAVCPDSNLALEKGLILNNPFAPVEEGKEVFISLQNTSGSRVFINNDEIIARLVLNPVL